ncbi:MAG TPA: methionyl-tRNA formyltransferase [Candidatus Eremiobacteraceae bacterium]|nr:methionyl-tRNA formyltransferase [Candidatus Eremiobacteraceae bacterium]
MRSEAAAKLPVVFFGTSHFAVPSLDALASAHDVIAVVTQPDRPAGRGLRERQSAVKVRALELGLDVMTPERLDAAFAASIAALKPALLACVSYGKILPEALLSIGGSTALNVHPSLLPEYRGASPIQAALREGRTITGVTVIWMSSKMDAGDIALQSEIAIGADEDLGALHDRLATVGASLLAEAARMLDAGALPRRRQDESRATYTRPIDKDDLRIVSSSPARTIVDLVRSASPAPGAWLVYEGKRLKVLAARLEPAGSPLVSADGPGVAAADGIVRFLRVVPEGKRAMSGAEFVRSTTARR